MPATAAANFSSILDRPSAEVERPRPVPVGTYTWLVKGQPRQDKSSKKQTEYVEFTLQALAAGEDVDTDQLDEYLTNKDGSKKALGDITLKDIFYLTDNSLWRLKDFLDHCGIEEGEKSLRQRVSETPGCQVVGSVRHEASEDGKAVFAKIGDTSPAE